MSAPYLIEIRTGGDTKSRLRDIICDVAHRFDVQAAAQPRAVPHVTLFGPYDTNQGRRVKEVTQDVLSRYDVVPYKITGFDRFEDNRVIYANVIPSPALRSLRRDLASALRPLTYHTQPWDSKYYYDYHITIAFKDVGQKFEDIWDYVTNQYTLSIEEYATRISSLRRREMMWEWDVPRGVELRPHQATSSKSWEQTEAELRTSWSPADHQRLAPKPLSPARLTREYWETLTMWTFRRRR